MAIEGLASKQTKKNKKTTNKTNRAGVIWLELIRRHTRAKHDIVRQKMSQKGKLMFKMETKLCE